MHRQVGRGREGEEVSIVTWKMLMPKQERESRHVRKPQRRSA